MKYIQTAVCEEDHRKFTNFAFNHKPQLTLGELIEVGIKVLIKLDRKEEEKLDCIDVTKVISTTLNEVKKF